MQPSSDTQSLDRAIMPKRPSRRTQTGSAATQLVECSVRVSPALARIMRKVAEQEAHGVSAVDALLEAAGFRLKELESLSKRLELASGEAKYWREKATHVHAQLEHLKRAGDEQNKETAGLRGELRKAFAAQQGAAQRTASERAQIENLTSLLDDRNKQLASSLSLFGMDDNAVLALTALRDHLANGEMRLCDTADETKSLIANLHWPEMRALSQMLERRGWQLRILRWLLLRS
jgi:chromosome segregation ATPase